MRLDKFVCKSTTLGRVQAVECIHAGRVVVNGVAVLIESAQVHENNTITLNAQLLTPRAFRYVMIHKPANTICSNVDEAYPSLFSDLNLERSDELHVAGRLDADTTGLVLATDDGAGRSRLSSRRNTVRKFIAWACQRRLMRLRLLSWHRNFQQD